MTKKLKTIVTSIRLTPELKKLAEKAAAADQRTVSSLLEKLLVEHLRSLGYVK